MIRLLVVFIVTCFTAPVLFAAGNQYRIGILLWKETPQALETATGFREGFELSGIEHEFDQRVAGGNIQRVKEFMDSWKEQHYDLIFTVGDRATRLAREETETIPIVFSAVTNPVSSELVEKWNTPGGNITGSSSWIKAEKKLETFRRAKPRLRTFGVIYNPDNAVSTDEVCAMFALAQAQGLLMHTESVSNPETIDEALEKLLARNIDALWLPEDDLVATNLRKIANFALHNKLSVMSSTLLGVYNSPGVPAFAQVGLTVDFHKLGHRSVFHAVSILTQGFPPRHLPIETLSAIVVANVNAADSVGMILPPLFLAHSDRVIRGFDGEKITIGGTGDSQKLLRRLTEELQAKQKRGQVEIPDSIGSTGGIKALLAGRVDLARTARPLRSEETALGLTQIMFAKSPVVFVVHPSVTGIDNLSTQDIIDIYSGKTRNWRDLGGSRDRIYAVSREPGDSSLAILEKQLPGFGSIEKPNAKTIFNTPDTVEALQSHRFTLGYVPLPETTNTKLKIMKLNEIYPSAENVREGRYPLVSPFYIVYRNEPNGLARAFIDFVFSDEGQKIITDFGAVPVAR